MLWSQPCRVTYDEFLANWGALRDLHVASRAVTVCLYEGGADTILIAINGEIRECPTEPRDLKGTLLFTISRPRAR